MFFSWRFVFLILFLAVLCVLGVTPSGAELPVVNSPSPVSSNPSSELTCGGFSASKEREPDFGLYIAELQRRIRNNWESLPPTRIVTRFYIDCAGSLSGLTVVKSSGNLAQDKAALKAIQDSAPFKPLPVETSSKTPIPVQFTFDYALPTQYSIRSIKKVKPVVVDGYLKEILYAD